MCMSNGMSHFHIFIRKLDCILPVGAITVAKYEQGILQELENG